MGAASSAADAPTTAPAPQLSGESASGEGYGSGMYNPPPLLPPLALSFTIPHPQHPLSTPCLQFPLSNKCLW